MNSVASLGSLLLSKILGGAKDGVFYSRRYASFNGLNSTSLDFLPVANVEEAELDAVVGSLVPIGKTRASLTYFCSLLGQSLCC